MKDENKTLIVSPDEEKSIEARLEAEKLLQQGSVVGLDTYATNNRIGFQNGSAIEFISPTKSNDVIRGKRSKLPMWLYDYESCSQDNIDKVIEPFTRKEWE